MDLTTMTPTPVQKINSGYLEGMLEILSQFEAAIESHKAPNTDEHARVRLVNLELIDFKHQLERLFDQVCDREAAEERRSAILRVEAHLPKIDMPQFANDLLRGIAEARQ
ncbi:hypothetical protein HUU59_11110 [bacterium]|nr:hypothetical protein [bacterium]